jgi:TolB protein
LKILLALAMAYILAFATDATIEVIKKAETLPSIAVEDASNSYDEQFRLRFFKALIADLNVISIFNVDRHYGSNDYSQERVLLQNKDMDYVLRYALEEMDAGAFGVHMKLLNKEGEELFSKNYRVNKANIHMFIAHAMAYDINEFMGEAPVSWIKRKVIFSKLTAPMKSEIIIADYTLTYQHTIVKGGLNVFPKWANKEQTAFYYTALATKKPTLKYVDIRKGSVKNIISSDGMMICSDVSDDGRKLLLTMAPKGQPDIYLYNVDTKRYTKETHFRGIDVNGQFFGNKKIVFVSSRLGYPNIFSKTLGRDDVEQMVYYGRSNSACSAEGKYVVYKARETSNAFSENTFNLHLISADTDVIRRLTATGVNEFPRFSRDGDAILFIKNYKGQSAIGIIRLNYNKNYLFPINGGRLQSLDW